MAVSFVHTGGTNGGKPGGGYADVLPSAWTGFDAGTQPQVGDIILVWCVFDNLSATTPAISTIAKAPTETNNWVQLAAYDSPNASAGAGTRGELWGIEVSSVASVWTSTLAITTTGGTVAAAMTQCFVFRGASLNVRGFQVNSSIAQVIGNAGDLVMGMAGSEGNSALTADTDTTGGVAWSTGYTGFTTGGGAASNVTSIFQYKIPTSNATQQYSAGALTDGYGIAIALEPAASNAGTGSGAATWTGSATGVNGNSATGNHTWATSATGDAPNPEFVEATMAVGFNLFLGEDELTDAWISNNFTSVLAGDALLTFIAINNQDESSPAVSSVAWASSGVTGVWERIYAFTSGTTSKWGGIRGELWGCISQNAWTGLKTITISLTGSGASTGTAITQQWRNVGLTPVAAVSDVGSRPWSASASVPAGSATIGMCSLNTNTNVGASDSDSTGGATWSSVVGETFALGEYPTWPTIEQVRSIMQYKIPTSTATQTYDITSGADIDVGVLAMVALGPPTIAPPQTASGTMRWTTRARGGNGRLYVRYLGDATNGWIASSDYINVPSWRTDDGGNGRDTPQPGDNLVWIIGYNATNTTSPNITSIAKPASEPASWVKLAEWNDGTSTRFEAWTICATTAWTNDHMRVSFSGTVGNKIDVRWVIRGNYGNGLELREAVAVDAGTSPWASTVTTAEWGDVLLGFLSVKSNTATGNYTVDPDSTNGFWSKSSRDLSDTGTSATSLSKIAQHKEVTGSGSQTLDMSCTDTTSTGVASVLVLAPKDQPAGDVALTGSGTLTLSGTPSTEGDVALSSEGTLVGVAPQQETGEVALAGEGTLLLAAAAELLPPANLTVTIISPTQLDISWDAATGATGYDLERDGVIISEYQPTTSYSDTGLTEGTTYTYRVRSQKVE
jgi:hypothetical protein